MSTLFYSVFYMDTWSILCILSSLRGEWYFRCISFEWILIYTIAFDSLTENWNAPTQNLALKITLSLLNEVRKYMHSLIRLWLVCMHRNAVTCLLFRRISEHVYKFSFSPHSPVYHRLFAYLLLEHPAVVIWGEDTSQFKGLMTVWSNGHLSKGDLNPCSDSKVMGTCRGR